MFHNLATRDTISDLTLLSTVKLLILAAFCSVNAALLVMYSLFPCLKTDGTVAKLCARELLSTSCISTKVLKLRIMYLSILTPYCDNPMFFLGVFFSHWNLENTSCY